MSKFLDRIPVLPLSALVFYLAVVIFWTVGFIPSPSEIFLLLESLYETFGLIGLFVASFLEGIVYFGLYFPGSFIVALAVFLSDGSFISLITISIVVAIALTITSFLNYIFGRFVVSRRVKRGPVFRKYERLSKGLFPSMFHPNILAFYFFNSGIKKQNPLKLLLVPVGMIPYGLFLAYILFFFKGSLRQALESPYLMITYILVWFFVSLAINLRKT